MAVARGTDHADPSAEGRRERIGVLALAVGATAYVGLVDPERGGAYPPCPSRTLLGMDCPACGGLRGTHDLLHGHLGAALDHNVLLVPALVVAAVALALWLAPLVGRRPGPVHPPAWAAVAALGVVAAFTVARNLPVAGLDWLASGA
ncbi:MAG TPA: DUF2752 domain-containing protein [Acidimicrobiales bacterium]|nr:DUF2752 domain-containing protein [Acidimicrobiales bacterium]